MAKTLSGGKVRRAPSLEQYDNMRPTTASPFVDDRDPSDFNKSFVTVIGGRTWSRDKALLVALGVDGDVPLTQARINAGLDPPHDLDLQGGFWVPQWLAKHVAAVVANDNHKIAAIAA